MSSFKKYYDEILRHNQTAPRLDEARKDFLQAIAVTRIYPPAI